MKMVTVRAQSILEYIIVFSAVLVAIIAGTIGFHRGVRNGLDNVEGMSDRLSNPSVIEESRRINEANIILQDRQARWSAEHPVVDNGTAN